MTKNPFRRLAVLGLWALVCLAGCGRRGASDGGPQAAPPGRQTTQGLEKQVEDPEKQLADVLAEMWARVQDVATVEARMGDYQAAELNRRERANFLQRFYELVDADPSGEPGWEKQVRVLRQTLAAHQPRLAERLDRGEFRHLLPQLLPNPTYDPVQIRMDQYGRQHATGGDGAAPPVADKARACADYFAGWVAAFGELYRQREALRKGFEEKTWPELERLIVLVLKVHPDAWLAGEGPQDFDPVGRIRGILRKHHPEVADAVAGFMKQNLVGSVRHEQDAVKRRLAAIAGAERRFRDLDVDGNGVADFWTGDVSGLFRLQIDAEAIELIPAAVAAADGAPLATGGPVGPLPPRPTWSQAGDLVGEERPSAFGFQAVPFDEDNRPLAIDTDGSGQACRNRNRFAFCAYPLGYGRVGRQTYLVTEKGPIWFKDTDGKPLTRLPRHPEAEGWTQVSGTDDRRPSVSCGYEGLPLGFLVKRLQSADANARAGAAGALGTRAAPSQGYQPARKVEHDDGSYHIEPARKPMTAAALVALVDRLEDPDHEVRQTAVGAVKRVGNEAVPPAVARLKRCLEAAAPGSDAETTSGLRRDAMAGLMSLAPDAPELPDLFARCLKDPNPETRTTAAERLAELGPRAAPAAPALVAALADSSEDVAHAAVKVLGQISLEHAGPEARAAIPRLAELAGKGDTDALAVMQAAGASNQQLAAALDRILHGGPLGGLGKEVIAAIEHLGPAGIRFWGLVLWAGPPQYGLRGVARLGQLAADSPEAVEVLADQMRNPVNSVRVAAAAELGRLGPKAATAVPALAKALDEEVPPEVRAAITAALAGIRGRAAEVQP